MNLLHHPKTFWLGGTSLMIGVGIAAGYVFQDWSQVGALPYYGAAFRIFSFLLIVLGVGVMLIARYRLNLRREPESLLTLLLALGILTWVMGVAGLVFPLDYQPLPQRDVMVFFAGTFTMLGALMTSLGITGGRRSSC